MSKAPWSDEEIARLQSIQDNDQLHPYTCPSEICPCPDDHNYRKLIPTRDGWVCHCGKYTQNWAHN